MKLLLGEGSRPNQWLSSSSMKKGIRALILTCILSIGGFHIEAATIFDMNNLFREVERIIQRHYPGATIERPLGGRSITFEFNAQTFMIHEPLKTGEWQAAHEERGPQPAGIVGEIEIFGGDWRGAARLPQTFDKGYYSCWVSAPYSKKLDAHLYVNLKVPPKFPRPFYDELMKLLNGFDQYVLR